MKRKDSGGALGAGRTQGEQNRLREGSWITTAGAWDFLSANAKELLLEQDNPSCSDRVNFKLAESFLDFFTSTVKSLGPAAANYNNAKWQSHKEWWMAERG